MTTETPKVPIHLISLENHGFIPLETQVAGHIFQPDSNSYGIMKSKFDGYVLKHLNKPMCATTEIDFYESIQNSSKEDLQLMKHLVPEYYGTLKLTVHNKEVQFLKLVDITQDIIEPCIMDIKIGKRTYDHLATPEKIVQEEEKYIGTKKTIGVCIPGFQVYQLPENRNCKNSRLVRFGKDLGKMLNVKTFKETLKKFLNAQYNGLCKLLIEEMLLLLRQILKWSRTQKSLKLYSTSILIVYDARRLFEYQENLLGNKKLIKNFFPSTNGIENGDFKDYGLNCIEKKRKQYQNGLMELQPDNTVFKTRIKMIDFAHTYPSDDNQIDDNYLFGIENLVKIFEEFLVESS